MRRRIKGSGSIHRTTILLPENVDQNLDYFCLVVQKSKSEVVTEAICAFLKEVAGLDATKELKLTLPKDGYLVKAEKM